MAKLILRRSQRRGVLLLLVLALLAMFGLLAISFVVMTGQAKRSTEAQFRAEQSADVPSQSLNEAIAQVIRGTENTASVLYPHSLLEDIYGNNTIVGTINSVANGTPAVPASGFGQLLNLTTSISASDAIRRVGCVLTITNASSPAAGVSFRIVGSTSTGALQVFREGGAPAVNDTFVVNGAPFSGTGQGFHPATGRMDLLYTDAPPANDPRQWPIALLPRPFANALDYQAWRKGPDGTPGNADDPSQTLADILASTQMNEDFDAADYHSMILAAMLPGGQTPIPSLHRPELVNYWVTQFPAVWSDITLGPQLRRKVILRPLGPLPGDPAGFPVDHPNFTGSNPNFNPIWDGTTAGGGQWDVDNDGDGVADSIWVDLGFPVRSAKDGRLYKQLVAVLCTDMDGRLNVNAHGNFMQANRLPNGTPLAPSDPLYYDPVSPSNFWGNWGAGPELQFVLSQSATPTLLRGFGYGPADVNLIPLLGGTTPAGLSSYLNLLTSRYGSAGVPGSTTDGYHELNKWYEFGGSYWSLTAAGTGAYGSPPNRLAHAAIGLDAGGRPLYCGLGWDAEKTQDPYKMNLVKPSSVNSPFTVSELEGLLRRYDADAGRLRSRLVSPLALQGQARSVTTDSWDIPSIPFPFPEYMTRLIASEYATDPPAVQQWLSDLLRGGRPQDVLTLRHYFRLQYRPPAVGPALAPAAAMSAATAWSAAHATELLPFELLSGRPMDINRPFGNGTDDSAAGSPGANIVDEPSEATGELLTQRNASGTTFPVAFNHTNQSGDSTIPAPGAGLVARQLYARHLYVLGMLLMDTLGHDATPPQGYFPNWAPAGAFPDAAARRLARARWIAQWAANAVDFRDRDSIMTRFDFDPDPFNDDDSAGKAPPGAPAWQPLTPLPTPPTAHTVWGCERPELLISETLATHDRRAENIADYGTWSPISLTDTPPAGWDPDFDQRLKPQGSLFIELYNPQSRLEPRPAELCDLTTGGVLLSRTTPADGGGVAWPVWRMLIASPVPPAGAPAGLAGYQLDPDAYDPTVPPPTIERSVYFATRPAGMPAGADGDGTVQFYTAAATGVILPGRYAVVGPGTDADGSGSGADYVTCFGRTTTSDALLDPDPATLGATRRIVLTPGATGGTPVASNGAGEPGAAAIQPVTSIVVNSPTRMNISEPDGGYPAYPVAGTDYYTPTTDRPLDYDRTDRFGVPMPGDTVAPVKKSGITPRVSVVYLQRLADPTRPHDPGAAPGDPTYNPYRTIDSAAIDLVAFNGWDADDALDPAANQGTSTARAGTAMLATRQRGDTNTAADGKNNIWIQHLELLPTLAATPGDTTVTHFFDHKLRHSLGYLTCPFLPDQTLDPGPFGATTTPPFTPLSSRFATIANAGDPNDTATPSALPWLTWNNRPFASSLELLLVPTASSSRLLNFALTTAPGNPDLVFRMDTDAARANPYSGPIASEIGPFPHLMNTFRSSPLGVASGVPNSWIAPRLYQLLSFLTVPSPFVGTEVQGNPVALADTTYTHFLYPPFNLAATYREPGRVNLNTIYDPLVWQGLINDVNGLAMGTPAFFNKFAYSRRGYTGGNWWEAADTSLPTRFANPFRSSAGARLNPVPPSPLLTGAEVNSTLLRPDPSSAAIPLFNLDPAHVAPYPGTIPDCIDTSRNAYFRHQTLMRLGNLVTTRSNVYAVWITVGYFEVTRADRPDLIPPVQPNWDKYWAIYPDGYWLGREMGSDTGDIKRHRAFYLIDRSIPVAFQRGRDNNVGNTILLSRFIE